MTTRTPLRLALAAATLLTLATACDATTQAVEPATAVSVVTPSTTLTTESAPTADEAAATVAYAVTDVVDGDTIHVVGPDGGEIKVRVIGIDAPERGVCGADLATEAMTAMVGGKSVTLTMGGDGEDLDRYGRALRYVDVDGQDAGLTLIQYGLARARYDSRDGYGRHDREDAYVAADAASPDVCATPATSPTPPPAPAVAALPAADTAYYANCAAARAAGATPIHRGEPGYRSQLDGDDDGVACE